MEDMQELQRILFDWLETERKAIVKNSEIPYHYYSLLDMVLCQYSHDPITCEELEPLLSYIATGDMFEFHSPKVLNDINNLKLVRKYIRTHNDDEIKNDLNNCEYCIKRI